jgi:hypothetical protein
MKVIYNKNQKHTLQYENLVKKGFKFFPHSEYLQLNDEVDKKIQSGMNFSEAVKEYDIKFGELKYPLILHNLELLKKKYKDLKVPTYVFHALDDLTFMDVMKTKDFDYYTNHKSFGIGSIQETIFNEKTEKLLEYLKPMGDILFGELFSHNELNLVFNTTNKTVDIKHGKQIALQSPFGSFDLYHLQDDSILLGQMVSLKKGLGLGNLMLGFLIMSTLQLEIPIVGIASVPEVMKSNKDNLDFHFLKKFYKKFDLEFDKDGWGKNFTTKNLIGNEQYLKDLFVSLEYFLDNWITTLEEKDWIKKVS